MKKHILIIILLNFFLSVLHASEIVNSVNLLTGQSDDLNYEYEYYQVGTNVVGKTTVELDKEDWRIGRIKTQKSSLQSPIYFFYQPNFTEVHEGLNHKNIYYFSKQNCIETIEHYTKKSAAYELQGREHLFWDASSTLVSRFLENEQGEMRWGCLFSYNEQGQLIKETLVGNFSGNCPFPLLIQSNGQIEDNGIESHSVYYEYDAQQPDLLIRHTDEHGATTLYNYDPQTKQCISELRGDQKGILARKLYFYDERGNLIETILDEGKNSCPDDLTDVKTRQMIRMQLGQEGPAKDQPLVIESYTVDIEKQQNDLLAKICYSYSDEGNLIRKDFYDSSENLQDSLHFSYDKQGHLAAVINNEGEMFNWPPKKSSHELMYLCDASVIGTVWNSLINSLYNSWCYLQSSSNQAWSQINVEIGIAPEVSAAFKKVGRKLVGDTFGMLMGYECKDKVDTGCYGQKEISPKVRLTFINGILTNQEMLVENLELICKTHGNVNVHYIFRPTEGWSSDIARALAIKFAYNLGYRSHTAHLLANLWRKMIEEVGGVGNGGVVIHYAHSLGGSDTDRARSLLTEEEQQMIRVVTFGSPTLIRNEGFQSVVHYISIHDGVSNNIFFDPLGHVRNYFDPHTNVVFKNSFFCSPFFPLDHLLSGKTYRSILMELGDQFVSDFSSQ
jgi:hypothetical protein